MINPIGKFIALKPESETITTKVGLVLSGKEAEELLYKKATVIAVGNTVEVIKAGDTVYYHKAGSFSMLIGMDNIVWTQERDILCVV